MNWGKKLTIGMLLFIAFIVSLAVGMMRSDTELVTRDYYNKSVDYDQKAQQVKNYQSLSEKPEILVEREEIKIFMHAECSGTITFYRPDNKHKDFERKFTSLGNDPLVFPRRELTSGYWKLILQWQQNGISYFTEKNIML